MEFKTPSRFYLAGQKISVEKKDLIDGEKTTDGMATYQKQLIEIKSGLMKEYEEFVFFHELTHHILNQMGEIELRANEKFVNLFSTFLHQAIKTMEQEE